MPALGWQAATVSALRDETASVRTLTLLVPGWPGHRPGQHVDIRLTAEDGYQAQRSYSIASAATGEPLIELTIERVADGEVSPFLHDQVNVGDRFEVRGPIGGYFVWDGAAADPLLLVAGGSGVVPLMAMIRHRDQVGSGVPCTLLYSSRATQDIIYADELELLGRRGDGLHVIHTLTRSQPPGWRGYNRRIDMEMLAEVIAGTGPMVQAFVCGPTPLVEVAAAGLVGLGLAPSHVRTERFGPSWRLTMTDTDPTDYGPHDGSLDANAIAGLLHEIFGAEMTITACRCAHCGNRAQIGSLRLYGMAGPGMVLRCSACSEMIMRIMRRPDGSYLVDARGAAYLRI